MVQDEGHLIIQQYMYSNFQLDKIYMLKYFHGDRPTKMYLYEHLTHEYFHTQTFLNLWYTVLPNTLDSCICALYICVLLRMYIHAVSLSKLRTYFMYVGEDSRGLCCNSKEIKE